MYNRYCAVIRASIHSFHFHIVYVSERNENQSSNVNLSELNRVLSRTFAAQCIASRSLIGCKRVKTATQLFIDGFLS